MPQLADQAVLRDLNAVRRAHSGHRCPQHSTGQSPKPVIRITVDCGTRTGRALAASRGNRSGRGLFHLLREEIVHGIALVLPSLETSLERANFGDANLLQIHRYLGAGGFAWASAIKNNLAVPGNFSVAHR